MKKTIKSVLVLFMGATLMVSGFISCNKDNEPMELETQQDNVVDDSKILSDENFLAMKTAIDNVNNAIAQSLQQQNVSFEEFKTLYRQQNESRFANIFDDNSAFINKNMEAIKINYEALVAKYPELLTCVGCDYNLANSPDQVISSLNTLNGDGFASLAQRSGTFSCGWQYYVCIAAVGLPAAACVIGSAGSGLVSGLCVAGFGAGALLCLDSYCTRV
ncbi:hypothetical protein [Ascidiimonas aurantiaca]|uniref:hypothetical protein n=1 Tax=Ascidiimonas aurantiaca TaxID=1685432 RepID=UPI0030EF680E